MSTLETTSSNGHKVLLEESKAHRLKLQALNDGIDRITHDVASVKHSSEHQAAEYLKRSDEVREGIGTVGKDLTNVKKDTQNIALTVMSAKSIGMQILSWYAYPNAWLGYQRLCTAQPQ